MTEKWQDDPLEDLERERTGQTDIAHELITRLAQNRFGKPGGVYERCIIGPQIRLRFREPSPWVLSVVGQATSDHGAQGLHPRRLAYLRDVVPEPVLWLAIGGNGAHGYSMWLIDGLMPLYVNDRTGAPIRSDYGRPLPIKLDGHELDHRVGALCKDLDRWSFKPVSKETPWRWPVGPPDVGPDEMRLFG